MDHNGLLIPLDQNWQDNAAISNALFPPSHDLLDDVAVVGQMELMRANYVNGVAGVGCDSTLCCICSDPPSDYALIVSFLSY